MGKPIHVPTIDKIEDKIIELELIKDKIIYYLNHDPQNLSELILIKYIKIQRVDKVAQTLNKEGFRIKSNGKTGERKYISNDVSAIIDIPSKSSETDTKLHKFTRTLFLLNKGKITWGALLRVCKE